MLHSTREGFATLSEQVAIRADSVTIKGNLKPTFSPRVNAIYAFFSMISRAVISLVAMILFVCDCTVIMLANSSSDVNRFLIIVIIGLIK